MSPKPKPVDGAADSNEFFYINENGEKDDTNLHMPIIREHDYPIIEDIMAPIREKHRQRHAIIQRAKRRLR